MADPTSTTIGTAASLTGGMVVLLGPVIGPWVAVMLAAFVGSLWTVGRAATDSRLRAALLLARIVFTALVLTGAMATLLAAYTTLALDYSMPLVAFVIGALGDRFTDLKEAAVGRLRTLIGG